MKNALNHVHSTNPNTNEVDLFRAMQSHLNTSYHSVLVEETHQCYVTFNSQIPRCTQIKKEISDLWIISFSKITGQVRMTFLQAKFDKKNSPNGNNFKFLGAQIYYQVLYLMQLGHLEYSILILSTI